MIQIRSGTGFPSGGPCSLRVAADQCLRGAPQTRSRRYATPLKNSSFGIHQWPIGAFWQNPSLRSDHAMGIHHKLFRCTLIKILIALRRFIE